MIRPIHLLSCIWIPAVCLAIPHTVSAVVPGRKTPPPPASFRASFVESHTLPGFAQPLVSRGRVRFNKKRGISWEVTSPYHYLFIMTSAGAEEQLPDGSIHHLRPGKAPWLRVVQHLFINALTGNLSGLKAYFSVRITPIRDGQLVILTPRKGPLMKVINSIQVTDGRDALPRSLQIDETSGGNLTIRFFDVRLNAGAP